MSTAVDLAWYAVWTRSRHEQVVRRELEQKDIEVFLPTVTRWSRWKDRKKQIAWPLFPGYCFARFSPHDRLAVLKCAGAVGIVSTDGVPVPVPEPELEAIRRLVESDLKFDPCPLIQEGAMVRLAHGPLKGVEGRLMKKGPNTRIVLTMELIGRAVSVEVDAADIRSA